MQNWNSDNYVRNAVADATLNVAAASELDGVAADVGGWDTITALVKFGVIAAAAVTSIKWQGSEDNSTWADLKGSKQTVTPTDDNKWFVMVLQRPKHRYVRIVITRATTNATVSTAVYIFSGPRYSEKAQAGEVKALKFLSAPIAGTA